jgi:hypothetical protein
MKPRERVFAALQHEEPGRVPGFEIWIDALLDELGQENQQSAYVNLGQDCVLIPSQTPPEAMPGWTELMSGVESGRMACMWTVW